MNEQQAEVYARQILLPEIGAEGQDKLLKAKVLIIGLGGLGSPVTYYLAAAGIGTLGLCDFDEVSLSNLNRQILYTANDIGQKKAVLAAKKVWQINPYAETIVYDKAFKADIAESMLDSYDIIVDCLDNFPSRFILNDACLKLKKPFVHGGVGQFFGQLLTVIPGHSPCLRCFLPPKLATEQNKDPLAKAIIGASVGVLGSLQALEVIKYILELKTHSQGLLLYNGLNGQMESVDFNRSANCPCAEISED